MKWQLWPRRHPMLRWHFKMIGRDSKVIDVITVVANAYQAVESAEDGFRKRYNDEPILMEWWTTEI